MDIASSHTEYSQRLSRVLSLHSHSLPHILGQCKYGINGLCTPPLSHPTIPFAPIHVSHAE